MKNKDIENYYHLLKQSFVISLSFTIILFYFSPGVPVLLQKKDHIPVFTIDVIDIPPTRQLQTLPPKPQKPVIPVAGEQTQLLTDVEIDSDSLNLSASAGPAGEPQVLDKLPIQPRQILEVLPEDVDNGIQGEITLKLRIGMDGLVKEDKVLNNTTNDPHCLQQVLNAARKSRWQPVRVKGQKVEYWIQKSYIFN